MLIVEDEGLMRAALREFVAESLPGQRILEAANGAQALQACIDYRPRVVLMDVHLPDIDGISLTAAILRLTPGVRIIFVSSHTGSAYVERARAAGACAYVAKENIYEELIPHVRRAMALDPAEPQVGTA